MLVGGTLADTFIVSNGDGEELLMNFRGAEDTIETSRRHLRFSNLWNRGGKNLMQ